MRNEDGTSRRPIVARTAGNGLNIQAVEPGTIWIRLPNRDLISLDCYGGNAQVVLYGDNPISIRTGGESDAVTFTPKDRRA